MFTPKDIEQYTEWTVAGLRDLRSKKYLSNYGTVTDGGHWQYSTRDLVAFWLASQLHEIARWGGAVDLHQIFASSWAGAEQVMQLIRGEHVPYPFTAYLWNASRKSGNVGGVSVEQLTSTADLDRMSYDKAELLNWKKFADTAPEHIRELV